MSRFRTIDAAAFMLAGVVVAGAQWKSFRHPDYDAMPETSAAFGLITAVWLVPTEKINEKVDELLGRVDKDL